MNPLEQLLTVEKLHHAIGVALAANRTYDEAIEIARLAESEAGLTTKPSSSAARSTAGHGLKLDRLSKPLYKIFISYRRADTEDEAKYLLAELPKTLAQKIAREPLPGLELNVLRDHNEAAIKKLIFLDTESIRAGESISNAINSHIDQCAAMLILIGPDWNPSRLSEPDDWVRVEILEALRFRMKVIPVILPGGQVPAEKDLPKDISALSRISSLSVTSAEHALHELSAILLRLHEEKEAALLKDLRSFTEHLRHRGILTVDSFETASGTYLGEVLSSPDLLGRSQGIPIPHGLGCHTTKDGRLFRGRWSAGEKLLGVEQYADGDKFAGEYRYSDRHGLGAYYYADDSLHSGSYMNGSRHGLGVYRSADGITYLGEYRRNMRVCGICVNVTNRIEQVCHGGLNFDLHIPIFFERI